MKLTDKLNAMIEDDNDLNLREDEKRALHAAILAIDALEGLLKAVQEIEEPNAGDTDAFWVAGNIGRAEIDLAIAAVAAVQECK